MKVAKFANVGKVRPSVYIFVLVSNNLPVLILQLFPHLYIAVCEYTDVEQIAEKCGGKRCVLYNSTTKCAECNERCGDTNGES